MTETPGLVAPQDPVHPAEYGTTLAGWLPHVRLGTLPESFRVPPSIDSKRNAPFPNT